MFWFSSSEEEGDEVENDVSDVLLKRDPEVEEDSDTNDIPESSTADEIWWKFILSSNKISQTNTNTYPILNCP